MCYNYCEKWRSYPVYDKLERLEERYDQLSELLADPDAASDMEKYRSYGKEQADLEPIVTKFREYKATQQSLKETQAMLEENLDREMVEMAKTEIEDLRKKSEAIMSEIMVLLLPKDPNDEK